jgi:excisionase family DNA binding protein
VRACPRVLVARLLERPENGPGGPLAGEDGQLLDVKEAARRLHVSTDWLYRRAGRLPFTVRMGGALRFSAEAIERYIRQREGR